MWATRRRWPMIGNLDPGSADRNPAVSCKRHRLWASCYVIGRRPVPSCPRVPPCGGSPICNRRGQPCCCAVADRTCHRTEPAVRCIFWFTSRLPERWRLRRRIGCLYGKKSGARPKSQRGEPGGKRPSNSPESAYAGCIAAGKLSTGPSCGTLGAGEVRPVGR